MVTTRLAGIIALVITLPLLPASSARAQGGDPGVLAEALFRDGRDLMAAGKYSEACPKFAESNRIDPKLGTLMNLALCHDKAGRSATAWAEYVEAAGVARRLGQAEREQVARDRAGELERSLSHVVIDGPTATGETVTLDAQTIGAGAFGTPVPVDPGDHVVRAAAPGRKAFAESFSLDGKSSTRSVHLPELEPDATAGAAPQPAAAATVAPETSPAGAATPGPSSMRTAGWITGGAGVVLVAVGSIFGVEAFSQKSTAESECDARYCTQKGLDAIGAMHTSEAVSTITIGAGLAAIGAGAYLVLSHGPHEGAATVRVSPDVAARGVRVSMEW